jgi:hypothetical protein
MCIVCAGAHKRCIYMDVLYAARGHDCMDAGVRAKQEARAEESEAAVYNRVYCQEIERIRTNIGHIRVKMSGIYFPDRVEEQLCRLRKELAFTLIEINR